MTLCVQKGSTTKGSWTYVKSQLPNYMQRLLLGALALVIVGGIAFISVNPASRAALSAAVGGASSGDVVKIGAALCLTGDCAEWGEGELKSIQLAVDEANQSGGISGKKIDLSVEDIQGTPQGAVNAMKKLIDVDHVEAVVGITWGDSFQAGYTVNNAAKVPSVAPSAALEALFLNKMSTEYVYSAWIPVQPEVVMLERYMQKNGIRHVALLHDKDPYGLMVATEFRDTIADQHMSIEKEFEFPVGYDDFRTTIAKLKEMNLDGVFLSFQSAAPKAKFLKQAKELGYAAHLYTTEDIQDDGLLKEFAGAMEGVIYVYPASSGNMQSFEDKFEKKYGSAPTGSSAANGYDAANVVISALTEHYAHGTNLNTAIRNVDIPGAFVKDIRFNDSHQLTGGLYQIKTIKGGKFTVVE